MDEHRNGDSIIGNEANWFMSRSAGYLTTEPCYLLPNLRCHCRRHYFPT